ncbi:DUF262 domain-containing protein [Hymenobacter crusticola]|uniref:GmrSD restriction endonucleases N-terminal domain-containing protein n=1 Tax=Hymenobacter crusticola TaxID=1770526 RepID=A0A243W5W8_9BACT|nr:DUF262 domain-containing protein [Hymenobacter crusticola]OUJ69126.1 hypothetical protein BXP70_26955 [Hymenobacter crusticola]
MTLKQNLSDLQQKARERTVKTQNIEYDLETLVKKIDKGTIKLDPDYQRRHRWDPITSSRLIESLILNIPIPIIYLSQDIDVDTEVDEESRYSVIDGQQRLTAIVNFFTNNITLTGLEALKELEGLTYKQLPPFLIRRLEERTIKCLRIDSTVDDQVKYDIFERLNSGSVKLEAQELRNAVARGPFNEIIKNLAKNETFRILIQVRNPDSDKKVQKMEDVELVLRFFALSSGNYINLKKGFKQFLDDEMKRFNSLDNNAFKKMQIKFISTMDFIYKNFGDEPFAKFRYTGNAYKRMSKFNAAVFDSLAVSIADNIIKDKKPELSFDKVQGFKELFKDPEFFDATEGSVNDREKVIRRIEAAINLFKK